MRDLARPVEEIGALVVEKELDEETRAALVEKMLRAREEIVRSGVPLLDWDDLEREIAERRGERNP
ncbi:MAG TPA: hypothetical protein VEW48_21135 [Thermoanaerobaculia bacterium]|nr:hypothetical protein [Thermoanaerobaculia bacterium]